MSVPSCLPFPHPQIPGSKVCGGQCGRLILYQNSTWSVPDAQDQVLHLLALFPLFLLSFSSFCEGSQGDILPSGPLLSYLTSSLEDSQAPGVWHAVGSYSYFCPPLPNCSSLTLLSQWMVPCLPRHQSQQPGSQPQQPSTTQLSKSYHLYLQDASIICAKISILHYTKIV